MWLLLCVLCAVGREIRTSKLPNDTEIVLVTVVFRHGERTPSKFYPNDPYKNETFYPIGFGGLTNKGKLMMYKLGEKLRNLYGDLLGDDYEEEKVYVRSTNVTRTKMSALLVLAGMWPPSDSQKWHPSLNWQPIPIDVKSRENEQVLNPVCEPLYKELRSNYKKRDIYENHIKPYENLFQYTQNNSGYKINDFVDINRLFVILKCEEAYGLKLPKWTDIIYPQKLYEAASYAYKYLNLEKKFRVFNSGYLMQKIIDDMVLKIENVLKRRRIIMYSGHDTSVAHLLCNLKLNCDSPDYGSTVIFELHKKNNSFFIKIKYLKQPLRPTMEDMTIFSCENLCPIDEFIKLQIDNDYLPTSEFKCI
ncbi:hypothetical protein FQR65_LT08516 [Abscondita terminalis]|nr:hypothetical protein FQR65_LT08516 [Abscondita terminalis]